MGKASSELIDMMTNFLVSEIGNKCIDGITYAFVLKDDKDKETYREYMDIRREANKCGYGTDEAFRVYEVSNGYIFDMDLSVAKKIAFELTKAVNKTNGGKTPVADLIGTSPDKRRKSDMVGLAKFVKSQFDAGNNVVEAALFSRNLSPRIMITGRDPKGNMVTLKYNAYAIRHWDIEVVNAKLLMPAGIRIAMIEPFEILPSKTGVKFKLYLEAVERY